MPQRHRNRKRKRRTPYERAADQVGERTPKSKLVTENLPPRPRKYNPRCPSPLLALPREIRDQIYEYVLRSAPAKDDSELFRVLGRNIGSVETFDLTPEKHHHGIKGANKQLQAEFLDAINRLNADGASYRFQLSLVESRHFGTSGALRWISFPDLQRQIRRLHIDMVVRLRDRWILDEDDMASDFDKCIETSFKILFDKLRSLVKLMKRTLVDRARLVGHHSDAYQVHMRVQELVIAIEVEMPSGTGTDRSKPVKLVPGHRHYEMMEEIICENVESLQDRIIHITLDDLEQKHTHYQPYCRAERSPRFDKVVFTLHGKLLEEKRDLVLPDELLRIRDRRVWREPNEANVCGDRMMTFCWLRTAASLRQEYKELYEARAKYESIYGIAPPW